MGQQQEEMHVCPLLMHLRGGGDPCSKSKLRERWDRVIKGRANVVVSA